MSDRTVHARYPGMEVVRYDRAGKWYLEPTDRVLKPQPVSVDDAAKQAVWGLVNQWSAGDGQVFFGRPGGRSFDRKVKEHLAEEVVVLGPVGSERARAIVALGPGADGP